MNLELVIAVIYLACATLLFILAFLIYRENQRKRINRITALMFGFAAFGPLFYGLGLFSGEAISTKSFLYNLVYVWELFFPQLVFFALCFPTETKFYSRFPRLKFLIFLPHAFHLLLTTIFSDPDKLVKLIDPKQMGTFGKAIFEPLEGPATLISAVFSALLDSHTKLFSIVNFGYAIIAAVILYQGTKRVVAVQLRKQVIIVIYGMMIALALYVIAFIFPNLSILTLSPGLTNTLTILALIIGCGSIIWAIVRYRFMDVRLIVRQSLVYTVTSALVVGAYVLIIRQFEKMLLYFFGHQVPGLDIVLIIVALILFQPVMSQMDDLIRKLFIKDKSDFRNITQSFSRKVASVFDLKIVFALAYDVLKNQLLIEGAYILLRHSEGGGLCAVSEMGGTDTSRDFGVEDDMANFLKKTTGVLNIDELIAKYPHSELVEYLGQLKVRFVTPLISGDDLLGCLAVTDKLTGYRLNFEDVTAISTIANQLALAVTTSQLYQQSIERQRLQEEMNIARTIQQELLPKLFPSGIDFEFTAHSEPALEVGGDYFDFIHTPKDTFGIVVADASGKGMPAALLVSQLQAAIRSEVRHSAPLSEMMDNVNVLIQQSTDSEKFATLFFADFDPVSKKLKYSNAGHNYPILLSNEHDLQRLDRGGLLLGAFTGHTYTQGEVSLIKDDVLLFYTDGLNEATNSDDEQFGEHRIVDSLKNCRHLAPQEIQNKIIKDVKDFINPLPLQDDMTIVVLKVT